MFAILAEKKQDKEHDHGQKGPPLKVVRKKPEDDKPVIMWNNRPAGAGCVATCLSGGIPYAVDEGPANKRRNGFQQKKYRHHRQNGIEPAVEQVGLYPADNTDMDDRRFNLLFSGWFCNICHGFSYRSTKAAFLLYQFIMTDVSKLKIRYSAMIRATPSMAWPV